MSRKILIQSVIFLFCLTMIGTLALAGLEPMPFKPQINKLNAIQKSLNSIQTVVMQKLGIPPDPVEPGPNVIGAVNSLEAKNRQLILLNGFLDSVMEEVLGFPPAPYRVALEGVRDASQGIADMIGEFLSAPPNPYYPEFLSALGDVRNLAQFLSDNASYYIDQTTLDPDQAYSLRLKHSDQCVTAIGNNNDAPVRQFRCIGEDLQQFRFLLQPTNDYLVAHVRSGKCLDVADWSMSDGVPLQLWTCHGGENQRFNINMRAEGEYELVSVLSDKCLSLDTADTVVQSECDKGDNQTITLEQQSRASSEWGRLASPTNGEGEAVRSAYFFVGSSKGTSGHTYYPYDDRHLHWDDSPVNREFAVDRMVQAGVNVILMSTWGRGAELDATNRWAPTWVTPTSRDQLFDLATVKGVRVAPVIETTIPHFALMSAYNWNCLHVPGGSLDSGTAMEATFCDFGNWNFQFRVQKPHWVVEGDSDPSDDNYREIRVHASAKCLDVRAYGTADGTTVQQWDCTDAHNQTFDVELVDADVGAYRFRDMHSGKCLHVNPSNLLVIETCSSSPRQRFYVYHTGGGPDPSLIWEKRYSLPDELGRLEKKSSPAPYLEDQITALIEHYVTSPDNPAWSDTWAKLYDRTGAPRHLVYLMFAKSSDTRLRHKDWKWAQDLQKVADNVFDRTGVGLALPWTRHRAPTTVCFGSITTSPAWPAPRPSGAMRPSWASNPTARRASSAIGQ